MIWFILFVLAGNYVCYLLLRNDEGIYNETEIIIIALSWIGVLILALTDFDQW